MRTRYRTIGGRAGSAPGCTTMGEAAVAAARPLKDRDHGKPWPWYGRTARKAPLEQGAVAVGGWLTGRSEILGNLRSCAAGLQRYYRGWKESGQIATASRHTTTATLAPYYNQSLRSTMTQRAQDSLAMEVMDLRREVAEHVPGAAPLGQLTKGQKTWVRKELAERTDYQPNMPAGGRRTRRAQKKWRQNKKAPHQKTLQS